MKLAYLTLHAPVPGQGAHTHVREIVRGLRRRGCSVDLFEPYYRRSAVPRPRHRVIAMIGVQLRLLRHLHRYDAVYIRHHPAAVIATTWCRWRGVPTVHEVNGTLDDWFEVHPITRRLKVPLHWASRSALRRTDGIVTVYEGLCRWVQTVSGRRDAQVVANAADPQHFRPVARDPRSPDGDYVVYLGALVPWEGVETALAASRSSAWPTGVRLVVAGEGPLAAQVRQEALRAPARVSYVGTIPFGAAPKLIAGSLAALSPYTKTEWGASPLKLYEAMACGVPVIASDAPGQVEVVRSTGCGLLFPVGDPDALATAVERIATEPDLRDQLGDRGRAAVLSDHNWETRVDQLLEVLGAVAHPVGIGSSDG